MTRPNFTEPPNRNMLGAGRTAGKAYTPLGIIEVLHINSSADKRFQQLLRGRVVEG